MRAFPVVAVITVLVATSSLPAQTPQIVPTWPGFRGANAAGIADGPQNLPESWNATTSQGLLWKAEVSGLGHSSPIVWGERVYVTSAISSNPDATFKPGLYGEGTASEDRTVQKFVLMAFERKTGKKLWERIATQGEPKDKRHIKSTYASSTPVTDGKVIVAFFGSNGLYGFDMNGKPLWDRDLGKLDVGAYDLPEYEWGPASSPIIYKDMVILQVDQQKNSFIAAFDVKSGITMWKTGRDELPSWGTPTVYQSKKPGRAPELVTNSSNFIRGYDPNIGIQLWRMGGSSKITAPTPIYNDDYIVVSSGRRDEKPIFVLRPGARGDITLPAGQTSSNNVVWSMKGRGPYMPTPIIHEDIVYFLGNDGIFDAYELATGKEVYRQRIPHGGSGFSASPVIADGRIILSSEDGDMFVVPVGRTFSVSQPNPMGEPLMATPAITGAAMYVRGEKHLFAIGTPPPPKKKNP